MKNFVLFSLLFTICASTGFAAAQSVNPDTLDIEAIRASAKAYSAEAEALAENVRARSEAVRNEARQTQDQARANRERYAQAVDQNTKDSKRDKVFDFDRMISDHAKMAEANLGDAPRFIAFASLSMPPQSLKALVRDTSAAGGVTVLRGFPGGSAKQLTKMLAAIASDGEQLSALGIDPRLFRAFDIKAAPSFVMASSDFMLCDGFDCKGAVPPHDRMTGNVSVEYALETFAGGAGPGSRLAALHLTRLKQER
ncbi:type-F conjugative transfer system pilin assembly protein TrbC [Parasphingorhabdus sp.]|uniref:type-F conjugative transfer system pilin assembly protein TrbC n=1 Tax=Parasphingorhabdus sp. TaxID=2709688 RepID=UPI003D2CE63A|tara:strand:- start:650 stop:1411 length:762 start_codon:yes stop_codon:yes gene_type:complete